MIDRFELFVSGINGMYRDIQKIERDEMVKYGLKGAYAQYLVAMKRCPEGLTATALCEACDKDKAAVSRVLTEMEEKGLVYRQGNKDNQYRALLILTPEGNKAADYVCEKAVAAVNFAGSGLSEEHRKIFYDSLHLIAAHLREICANGIPED